MQHLPLITTRYLHIHCLLIFVIARTLHKKQYFQSVRCHRLSFRCVKFLHEKYAASRTSFRSFRNWLFVLSQKIRKLALPALLYFWCCQNCQNGIFGHSGYLSTTSNFIRIHNLTSITTSFPPDTGVLLSVSTRLRFPFLRYVSNSQYNFLPLFKTS